MHKSKLYWYRWIGLCQIINRHIFKFFVSVISILFEFKGISRLIQKTVLAPNSQKNGLYIDVQVQASLFSAKPVSKICGNSTFYDWRNLQNGLRRTACAAFWRIFSSNKSAPANRKKGFYTQDVCRSMRRIAPKNFEL